jgi:3-hydroxyacyl-CoA dehydrogenase
MNPTQWNIAVIGGGVMAKAINRLLLSNSQHSRLIESRKFLLDKEPNLENLDLIIECVTEDFNVKAEILEKIRIFNKSAIISSSTSSLSIADLQERISFDEKFLGIHFMNPPSQINVVELVPAKYSDPDTVSSVDLWLRSIGQEVVLTQDNPGFLVNALLFTMFNRAAYMLDNSNATASEIDLLMVSVSGHKLGPFRTMDLIGIDTCKVILENLHVRDPLFNLQPANIFEEMISRGALGRKARNGFYKY